MPIRGWRPVTPGAVLQEKHVHPDVPSAPSKFILKVDNQVTVDVTLSD
jgi:hypothetical protein